MRMTGRAKLWGRHVGRKTIAAMLAIAVLLLSGCAPRSITVYVTVMNYNLGAIANVWVDDHYVGGFYHGYAPGTIGGGAYCCITVKPGPVQVRYEFDRTPSDPRPNDFFKREATGVIPKPHGPYRYLGVHIYPDNHVEFTLSRDLPDEKKEGGESSSGS